MAGGGRTDISIKGFPFGSGGLSLAAVVSGAPLCLLLQKISTLLALKKHLLLALGLSDGAVGTITRHSKMLRVYSSGGVDVSRP